MSDGVDVFAIGELDDDDGFHPLGEMGDGEEAASETGFTTGDEDIGPAANATANQLDDGPSLLQRANDLLSGKPKKPVSGGGGGGGAPLTVPTTSMTDAGDTVAIVALCGAGLLGLGTLAYLFLRSKKKRNPRRRRRARR